MQEIYFERSDSYDDIDVYFTYNPILTDIPFSGEIIESSTYMIILIGENTPSGEYLLRTDVSFNDIGRVDGGKYAFIIEFTVCQVNGRILEVYF